MRTHIVLLWLFIILFFSTSFSISTSIVVSGYCLGHQQSLLLHLKNNITTIDFAEPTTKLVRWNQSVDCCEWEGVTCNEEGLVIGLDLSQESISGGINSSSSLFSLQSLQSLNLAYNFIKGVIPLEIGKLTNLMHLNLSKAGFRGQVPVEISQLRNLLTLDLSASELDLKLENPNLPRLIRNFTKITKLYLDGVSIAASGNEWGNAISSSMPNLEELSLSRCNLQGPIDFSLAKLRSLKIIRLSWNALSSAVPEFFASFENLTLLDLRGCRLQGIFPEKIWRLERLEFLDLSYNTDLHGSLSDHFAEIGSLQTMILKWTKFSGPLPNSIGNLNKLSTLDLFRCQFNGTLPSSMSKLTKLSYLRLSSNSFTGPVPSFNMSKKLTYLDLSKNDFNNSIPSTHFHGLLSLTEIRLHNNNFSGKVPSSMFELPSVQMIRLQQNQFDGKLDEFANSSSTVQGIYMSSNVLQGPIPKSMFELTRLKILDLSYSNLSVVDDTSADSSVPSFPALISLSLASCKLKTFPQFLKNRNQTVAYLDLSANHLSGLIPHWIWIQGSLNLSQNYLTEWEEVPLHIDSSLYLLDLHSNQLQRMLPVHPMSLLYIDFSSNNLNGSIPESICDAEKLVVLNLANNSLTGKLPGCLIAMNGSLTVLNVRGNKLTGSIDTIPSSCGLRTLDLNGNFLEGKLPAYLSNCTSLEVMDLGNNLIDDKFPCWLKSVSTLRVLILRSNKLHGSIDECPAPEAAWPSLQIIDLAANNFTGRIPPSLLETWKTMKLDQSNRPKMQDLHFQLFGQVKYQDRVTLVIKDNQVELVKILTIYTSIDFSCNIITGPIPEEIGELKALYILNLSHNALEGNIPTSLGNLMTLESLDLSNNSLSGKIPTELSRLTFLSSLNLSFNHLVGVIPTSTQLQSFDASSFKGNEGLCGPPLTPNCSGAGSVMPPKYDNSSSDQDGFVDWNFISAELGFTFGVGIVIIPLLLLKRWRLWYCKNVEDLLYRIFPQLDFVYENRGGKRFRVLRWVRH